MYICMKALVLDLGDRVISLVLGRDAAGIVPHDAPHNIWPLLKKEVILPLVYCPLRSCCGIEYFFKPTIHGIVFSKKCSRDLTQDRRVTWSDIIAIHSHAIGMWSRLTGGKSLSRIAYRLSRPSHRCMWKPLSAGASWVSAEGTRPPRCPVGPVMNRYLSTPASLPSYF